MAGNIFVNLADAYNHFPRMGSNLKHLILKRCYITYVQDRFFQNLDVLQYLNLAENQLRRVPAAVRRPSLLHLDLSYQCWPLLLCPFDLACLYVADRTPLLAAPHSHTRPRSQPAPTRPGVALLCFITFSLLLATNNVVF